MQEEICLSISKRLKEELQTWAEDEFRSLNGQIEFILVEAVKRRSKLDNYNNEGGDIVFKDKKEFGRTFIGKGDIRAVRTRRPARIIEGYKIYELDGREVGTIYMTDDKRSPHYGFCEIYFNDEYQEILGVVWKRFKSNGKKIAWSTFNNEILKKGYYEFYVD